jgi:hypothetical protein
MLDDEYELAKRYQELEAKLAFVSGLVKFVRGWGGVGGVGGKGGGGGM